MGRLPTSLTRRRRHGTLAPEPPTNNVATAINNERTSPKPQPAEPGSEGRRRPLGQPFRFASPPLPPLLDSASAPPALDDMSFLSLDDSQSFLTECGSVSSLKSYPHNLWATPSHRLPHHVGKDGHPVLSAAEPSESSEEAATASCAVWQSHFTAPRHRREIVPVTTFAGVEVDEGQLCSNSRTQPRRVVESTKSAYLKVKHHRKKSPRRG